MEEIQWYCRLCGTDLGEGAEVASGDCVECERILCEGCYAYDEATATVSCPPGSSGRPRCVERQERRQARR